MKTKTLLLTLAALGLAAVSSYAQGTINFAGGSGIIQTNNGVTSGSAATTSSGSGIYVELLYQPDTAGSTTPAAPTSLASALQGGWELAVNTAGAGATTAATAIAPTAGRFGITPDSTGVDVGGGGNVYLDVIGWNGGYNTLAGAQAGSPTLVGIGSVFTLATGAPNGTPPTSPVSTSGAFSAVTLTPVPEPTDRKSVV